MAGNLKPLACSSWFYSHFDNVMTEFIINKRGGQMHIKLTSFCQIEYKIPDLQYGTLFLTFYYCCRIDLGTLLHGYHS